MLVLSRKPQEKIVFPHLGITLEIVRVEGGKVRVGIEAPRDVAVLRGELAPRVGEPDSSSRSAGGPPRSWSHHVRNRLHTAGLGLKLLEKQFAAGLTGQAEETLNTVLGIFQQLEMELQRSDSEGWPAAGRRALIVEDDSNEAELLAGILRLSGYEVDTAADGLEALEVLRDHTRPDFVLLDMNMPRCDGPTTLAAIRSNPAWDGLRVFAVSGSSHRELGITIGKAGVDRWFQKPLNPEILLGAMQGGDRRKCIPA